MTPPTNRIKMEFALALMAALAAYLVAGAFDITEKALEWSRQHEGLEIDEIFTASTVLVLALALFSLRRWSELRREVAQRRKVEEALREGERRYRAVVEDQTEMICRTRPDDTITFVNRAYCQYFGKQPEDLVGQPFVSLIVEEDERAWQKLVARLSPKQPVATVTYRAMKGGDVRWQEWTTRALYDERGHVSEYQSVGRDITERIHAEEQRLQLTLEQEKVDLLARFIRDASHEFRTPLAVMTAELDLLRRMHTFDADVTRQFSIISDQVMYLNDLVNALLTMSRLDAGAEQTFSLQNLNTLVEDIAERITARAEAKALALTVNLNPDLPPVQADPVYLGQALLNICQNAIDFTPEGGSIVLRTFRQSNQGVVEIADTGVGISQTALPLVFERFYREDAARTGRRAGMGLAIARKIVEQHGGEIEVSSRVDEGTTVRVVLPLVVNDRVAPAPG